MNCHHCQNLLLDHLYGLLEGAEAASVESHLASCPACAAARAETARVQGLIARAAKAAFPATKFEAPAQPQAQPAKSNTRTPVAATRALPRPARPERGRSLQFAGVLSWAVAAAVLIAIPGTVLPVLNMHDRARAASADARTAKLDAETAAGVVESEKGKVAKGLGDAEFARLTAEQARTALLNKWVEEQKAAVLAATQRKFSVDVLKPAAVLPGAPNDFLVVVNDRRDNWQQAPSRRMVAEVHAVDSSDAVIYSQPIDVERTGERKHALRLPASAWAKVKPNAELYLVVAEVDDKTQTRTELQERVRLAGPVYTTLLVTDKGAYRPGERLFFRSLTLDRISLRPPARDQVLKYELLNPDGTPVDGLNVVGTTDLVRVGETKVEARAPADGKKGEPEAVVKEGKVEVVRAATGLPVRGVGCGEFVLPPNLPDGDYTLRLTEGLHPGGFPATVPLPVTRTVKVRSGSADNYRKEVTFAGRASYSPGEAVEALAELKFQGQPAAGVAVAGAVVEVDKKSLGGVTVAKETDANGVARLRFALPAEVLDGDVRLKVTFRTPHGDETVAERVPVVGNRVKVEFFPECGDALVAGAPCKVYVRATTPAGQPVDFRGVVTDGRRTIATVESLRDEALPGANRGLAAFTYTPEIGTRVWLKLESPAAAYAPILKHVPVHGAAVALMGGAGASAAVTGFELPEAKDDGVVMSVLDPLTAPGEPIRVQLHCAGQPRVLVVGAYTRGRLSDTQQVNVEPGIPQTLKLMAGSDPRGGVVRVTAFEKIDEAQDLKPVAERLVFRKPGEVLNLALAASSPESPNQAPAAVSPAARPAFPAGAAIELGVTATDEKGNPAAAILWAAAVNSGAAPGKKDRALPTHFLLAGEVKDPADLEYADFLLTGHPKATEAIDLLLGTQGWRRFAEQSVPAAPARQPGFAPPAPELARLMVENGQYAIYDQAQLREHRELYQKYAPRYEAAVKAAESAKARLEATRAETREPESVTRAAAEAEQARRSADERAARAEAAREPLRQFRSQVWYGVGGLAALALCCALASYLRPATRLPLGFSTLGSIGLAAFLVVAAGWGEEGRAAAKATADPAFAQKSGPAPAAAPERDRTQAAAPAPRPAPPAPPAGGAKIDRGGPKADAIGGGFVPRGPPGVTGVRPTPAQPESAPARDFRPPFVPYQPPVIAQNMNRFTDAPTFGKGGYGMGGLPVAPVAPLPSAPPTAPVAPVPEPKPGVGLAPPGALAGPGAGWHPNNPNGVSAVELTATQFSKMAAAGGAARAANDAVESLRNATDLAHRYARDRSLALREPMEHYFKLYESKPGPKGAPAKHRVETMAYQQVRGSVTPMPPLVVREFAAPRPAPAPVPGADESPDTVLWQPVVVVPGDGKVTLHFHLGIAPGGYQVLVAGHTADGRLGYARGLVLVSRPQTPAPIGPTVPGGQGVPGGAVLPPAPPTAPLPPAP